MKLLAVISKEASLGVIKYFPKLKCGFIKTDKFQNFDIWKYHASGQVFLVTRVLFLQEVTFVLTSQASKP